MASTYLTRTGSTGNRKTLTISYWLKRGNITTSNSQGVLNAGILSDGNNHTFCGFESSTDTAIIQTTTSGSNVMSLQSNALFRDTSAWYNFVWKVDTTQATESDRITLYVNNVEHSLTGTYPSQNQDTWINYADTHTVGTRFTNYFDGSMSHFHLIDGTAYDATAFGEYDANGVWTINTSPSVTYGTNGFFILKDGNSVTDQSGNGNNFTVGGGTLTKTEDCPDNVFATFNPLAKSLTGTSTYSNGNTTVTTDDTATLGGMSTLGITSGKWYAEAKRISQNSGAGDDGFRISFGVTNVTNHSTNVPATTTGNYFIIGNGTVYNGSSDLGVLGGSANISDNGVQQIALDLDNNRITWGFNGQWMNGSGAYNQSSPSNWVTITDPDSTEAGYFFLTSDGSTGRGYTASWNFGNGYLGTTAVASAGTNASGIGIFEYDVPTGYTALSTKGLNL